MSVMATAGEEASRRHLSEIMAIQQLCIQQNAGSGSVLAIVNFPDDAGRDCTGITDFGKTYRLRIPYDRIVATGSSKLMKMLEPKRQQRNRRLLGMETLPDGVEYVLDMTPPSEGEESAELTASLWLPPSTKLWWMAGHFKPAAVLESGALTGFLFRRPLADKAVGAVLCLGHDDKCSCITGYRDISDLWATKADVPGIYPGKHVPPYRNIDNYCKVRHCVNVLRILRAIAGEDLLINSATRMWTLVHVGLNLEVAPLIRDGVTQWFSAPPNTKFIEMFPEESFKIALKLQMRDVVVAAFKILVNERAVDHAATIPLLKLPPFTWMERKREDYGDLPEDPIEHASRAFADRMKQKLDMLLSDEIFELMDIPQWKKFKYFGNIIEEAAKFATSGARLELLVSYQTSNLALLDAFRLHIQDSLDRNTPENHLASLIIAQRAHYGPSEGQTPVNILHEGLNNYQKACLPFLWGNLRDHFPDYHLFKYRKCQGAFITNLANEFSRRLHRAFLTKDIIINEAHVNNLFPDNPGVGFNLELFHIQLDAATRAFSRTIMAPSDPDADSIIPFLMSDHLLLNLDEGEMKYLPLWAGGWDDGSGGVFQEEIPMTDMGPSEPGPNYHTGHTIASNSSNFGTDSTSTIGGYTPSSGFSDLGMDGLDLGDNTAARSMDAQDSASVSTGTLGVVSVTESEFSHGDSDVFGEARYAQPAEHQVVGQAVAQYAEGTSEDGSQQADTDTVNNDTDRDDVMDEDSDGTLSFGDRSDDDEDYDMI